MYATQRLLSVYSPINVVRFKFPSVILFLYEWLVLDRIIGNKSRFFRLMHDTFNSRLVDSFGGYCYCWEIMELNMYRLRCTDYRTDVKLLEIIGELDR